MNSIPTGFVAFLLLILLTGFQADSPKFPSYSSKGWINYKSAEGKVKIKFPDNYETKESSSDRSETVKINCEIGEENYFLSYTLHQATLTDHKQMAGISLNTFAERLQARILQTDNWIYKNEIGKKAELVIKDQNVRIFYRVLLVGQVQYQLIVILPQNAPGKKADKFFKSFKLLRG